MGAAFAPLHSHRSFVPPLKPAGGEELPSAMRNGFLSPAGVPVEALSAREGDACRAGCDPPAVDGEDRCEGCGGRPTRGETDGSLRRNETLPYGK